MGKKLYFLYEYDKKSKKQPTRKEKNVNETFIHEEDIWDNEDIDAGVNCILEQTDLSKAPSEPFTDKKFPAASSSLTGGKNDKNSQKLIKKVTGWKRVSDISPKPELFIDGSEAGDVCQGSIGDCWFIGAMSVVATTPVLMKHVFVDDSVDGTICCRFYKDEKWNNIVIDDYLPVSKDSKLAFARGLNPNELWAALCEKAYAKLHGGYRALIGGHTEEGLADLTGGIAWKIKVKQDDNKNDKLWNLLSKGNREDIVMGAAIIAKGVKHESGFGDTGLLSGHAYGILQTCEVNQTRLIQIRNPWGKSEWLKDWSDSSSKWDTVSQSDKKRIGFKIGNDGSFFMSYDDFCQYWTTIGVCRVFFRDQYLKQMFDGSFSTKMKTNGSYLDELPQYHLLVNGKKAKQEVVISLYQSDKRMISNKKNDSILIGFQVYKCEGKKIITTGIKVASTVATWSRESVAELELENGEYMIVPFVYNKGDESPFWLRVYSIDLIELDRVHPLPNEDTNCLYKDYRRMNAKAIDYFLHKDDVNFFKKKNELKPIIQKSKSGKAKWIDKEKDVIDISKDGMSCFHTGKDKSATTSYSNQSFSEGRNYFEVKIDKSVSNHIMVGVVNTEEHNDHNSFIIKGKQTFSYYSLNGKSYHNGVAKLYGAKYFEGDSIGISVDHDKQSIEFYLNGISQGIAYTKNIIGSLTPAVTLYQKGDSISIVKDAREPERKIGSVGVLKNGSRIFLKTAIGGYWEGSTLTSVESTERSTIVTITEKNGKFQFKNTNCLKEESSNTDFFDVVALPNPEKNGYTIQSPKTGDYMGWSESNKLISCKTSEKVSKWFISLVDENSIYDLIIEGDTIAMKSLAHNTYFGYENGVAVPYKSLHDNCKYKVERAGEYFKFKLLSNGKYLHAEDSTDIEFFLTEENKGISLQGKTKYLGISENGKSVLYDDNNVWNSRFSIQSVSSDLIFKNGNQIAFKSKLGKYITLNRQRQLCASEMNQFSVFTVGRKGSLLTFSNKLGFDLNIKSSSTFQVKETSDGITLFTAGRFLASNGNKVFYLKCDDGKDTKFYVEDIDDQNIGESSSDSEMSEDESHHSDPEEDFLNQK
eukprot:gene8636-583_t